MTRYAQDDRERGDASPPLVTLRAPFSLVILRAAKRSRRIQGVARMVAFLNPATSRKMTMDILIAHRQAVALISDSFDDENLAGLRQAAIIFAILL